MLNRLHIVSSRPPPPPRSLPQPLSRRQSRSRRPLLLHPPLPSPHLSPIPQQSHPPPTCLLLLKIRSRAPQPQIRTQYSASLSSVKGSTRIPTSRSIQTSCSKTLSGICTPYSAMMPWSMAPSGALYGIGELSWFTLKVNPGMEAQVVSDSRIGTLNPGNGCQGNTRSKSSSEHSGMYQAVLLLKVLHQHHPHPPHQHGRQQQHSSLRQPAHPPHLARQHPPVLPHQPARLPLPLVLHLRRFLLLLPGLLFQRRPLHQPKPVGQLRHP